VKGITLRRAATTDTAHIAALMSVSFNDGYGEAWQSDDLPAVLAMPGTAARLALTKDGAALGFTLWRQTLDEAELLLIAVRPDVRRLGLGRVLMSDLLASARHTGVREMFLEVREGNSPALHLYRSEGFETVGRRSAYYKAKDGTRYDALTLRCQLGGCQQAVAR
jgi:[ribosomal protein S18]-alanine N-acetyltransferase